MCQKRLIDDDESTSMLRDSRKRRNTNHGGDDPNQKGVVASLAVPSTAPETNISAVATRRNEYDIAWICALYIEMAAARAMLDEINGGFPQDAGDSNSYVFGRIREHNIVITCLPDGQYGTNNAANVVTNLQRTFPAIRLCLMVGIGGGVPSKADVRLGDVVVGSRVMQYDLGKVLSGGEIQRTAIPRPLERSVGTAVSNLRAIHELEQSAVPAILSDKMSRYPNFCHPNLPDRLFQSPYRHLSLNSNCDKCDHLKLRLRSPRASKDPFIHYGAIASGNQVIKDASTRDEIAKELDIICFEMEAAGLQGSFPSLTIRGICDYSDSHKGKEWQRYAAATAAAYAREFLVTLPAMESPTKNTEPLSLLACENESQSRGYLDRKRLLHFLNFEQIDSRKSNIRFAHAETCEWFLHHSNYTNWLDPKQLPCHHGFLWLSGKPGAGKSTMMKFACTRAQGRGGIGGVVASFFFNARGEHLERSIVGMYRSLILQLLKGYGDLQALLEQDGFLPGRDQDNYFTLDILKALFHRAIMGLGMRSFTCFIDALDECDEQQALDMIQYFQTLTEDSTKKQIQFRICFSSRHYPYLDIHPSLRLILENQPGHMEDLTKYIRTHLKVRDPTLMAELQDMVLKKASGVFLWIAMVVEILNQEDRHGRPTLKHTLTEMPDTLSDLFRNMLSHDRERIEDLRLCAIWVLFSQRPLDPTEYYHALWSGLYLQNKADPQVPKIQFSNSADNDTISQYIISSSKGLAEVTKTEPFTVQFIHESVRDFLLKDGGLQYLWPEVGYNTEGLFHETAKKCCEAYINHNSVQAALTTVLKKAEPHKHVKALELFPFLEYSTQNIMFHANAAAGDVPQDTFVSQYPEQLWVSLFNVFEKLKSLHYDSNTSLLYIFAEKGLSGLISTYLGSNTCIDIIGGKYRYPYPCYHADAVFGILPLPTLCRPV